MTLSTLKLMLTMKTKYSRLCRNLRRLANKVRSNLSNFINYS